MTKATVTKEQQAAAILAAEQQNAEVLSNHEVALAAFVKTVEHYGAMAARGKAQLTRLAMTFADNCRAKIVSKDDARKVYEAYARGHNECIAHLGSTAAVEFMGENVIKSGASILGTFGHPAVLLQGNGLYERIVVLRNQLGAEDRSASAYSSFAKVNREIAKLGDAKANVETVVVSDEQIIAWISKPKSEDKTDLKRLQEMQKAIASMRKAGDFNGLADWATMFDAYVTDFTTLGADRANSIRNTLVLVAA